MGNFSGTKQRVGAFTLRVNMPCSRRNRTDIAVNFPSDRAFQQWMACIHNREVSGNLRAPNLAAAAKPEAGLSEEERVAEKRQEALEMLEGVRPQHKMRDYSGPFRAQLEEFARQDAVLEAMLTRSRELDRLDWPRLHLMIRSGLPETDRLRFPPVLGKGLKPILLRLSPRQDEFDAFDRVCGARNLQGMLMSEFRNLMAEVARGGWQNHVLWVCNPAEGYPYSIRRKYSDPMPIKTSDNFF